MTETKLNYSEENFEKLYEALDNITNHFADVMGGPIAAGLGVKFMNGVEGIPTIAAARGALKQARGES